jgi:hypothetical protein
MSDTHEVISAFLDDEPFDAQALVSALSDPAGRVVLIDMVALRHLVQTNDIIPPDRGRASSWSFIRLAAAAAAVLVALMGGYFVGERRATASLLEPPAATRIVQSSTNWQEIGGGVR